MKCIKFSEIELWIMYLIVYYQHARNILYTSTKVFTERKLLDKSKIYSIVSNNTPLNIYNGTPSGVPQDVKGQQLPINQLKGNPTEDCSVSNVHRCKKALVLLSGGSQLANTSFIRKTVDDLCIENKYDVFVYENKTQLNFLCIENIVDWLQTEIRPKYDDLVIIGFSNGGVIASHVMHHLESKQDFITKKLITIDSMNHMFTFLKTYEKNKIYRQDIMGCYMSAYCNSFSHFHLYNRLDIFDVFKNTNIKKATQYFTKMYNVDRNDLKRVTTMNYDLRNCKIVNIYSHFDPIIQRYYNKQAYEQLTKKISPEAKSNITNISFPMITHCSQMFDKDKSGEFTKLLLTQIFK